MPTLDHFTIEPVSSPQYVGLPFTVNITARDFSGGVLTGYSGTAALTDTTGHHRSRRHRFFRQRCPGPAR